MLSRSSAVRSSTRRSRPSFASRKALLNQLAFDGVADRLDEQAAVDAALDEIILRSLAHGCDCERLVIAEPVRTMTGRVGAASFLPAGEGFQALAVGQAQVEQ